MAKSNAPMNGGTISSGRAVSMPPARTAPVRGTMPGKGSSNPASTIKDKSAGKGGGMGC